MPRVLAPASDRDKERWAQPGSPAVPLELCSQIAHRHSTSAVRTETIRTVAPPVRKEIPRRTGMTGIVAPSRSVSTAYLSLSVRPTDCQLKTVGAKTVLFLQAPIFGCRSPTEQETCLFQLQHLDPVTVRNSHCGRGNTDQHRRFLSAAAITTRWHPRLPPRSEKGATSWALPGRRSRPL